MDNIHFILQGKGGVGKSFAAVLKAQYLQRKGRKVVCADTDPVNQTFSKYKALDVATIEITTAGHVEQRKFDPLMEAIATTEADFVIDNGAATFLPLMRYLTENDIYKVMSEFGKQAYIHTILVGGQAQSDTYDGLAELLSKVDKHAKVVIWENEFWGKIAFDGVPITGSKLFKESEKAGKIAGVVKIIDRNQSDTFVGDIKQMTCASLTLPEVMASKDFQLMAKHRLNKVVGDVFTELDKVNW